MKLQVYWHTSPPTAHLQAEIIPHSFLKITQAEIEYRTPVSIFLSTCLHPFSSIFGWIYVWAFGPLERKMLNLNTWFSNCGAVTTGNIWGSLMIMNISDVQNHHWNYYLEGKCCVIWVIVYDNKWGTGSGGYLWCVSFISEVYILELGMIMHDT